jgi:riboflavin synthase
MFTGIIEEAGTVRSNQEGRMWIDCGFADELKIGQSVCCSGVCLTAVEINSEGFAVDIMEETFDKTYFRQLGDGDLINLERSLKFGDRMDGHKVQGHVDAVGIWSSDLSDYQDGREFSQIDLLVRVPRSLTKYIVYKGSITLDGISFTVGGVEDEVVKVCVIPHTWEVTNLKTKEEGSQVNVEVDVMAKHLRKLINCNS